MRQSPTRQQTLIGGFLILLLVLGSYVVGFIGWGSPAHAQCNSPSSILQCGTVTFTLTAASSNLQTITFNQPGFTSTPGHFGLDFPSTGTMPTVVITTAAPIATFCFICSTNTGTSFTWTNMPVTTTEIFGDANREHQVITTSPISGTTVTASSFRIAVDCITGSNSATAVLEAQWSTDDASWNDLANVSGAGDIPIDTAIGHCPSAGSIIGGGGTFTPVTINSAFPVSSGQVYLRIVGKNGGGVGDVPAFAWLSLAIKGVTTGVIVPCFLDQSGSLTATSVSVRLRCAGVTTVTVTFRWTARI